MGNLFEILPLELIDLICEKINICFLSKFIYLIDELPPLEIGGDIMTAWNSPYKKIFIGLNQKRLEKYNSIKRGPRVIKKVDRTFGFKIITYCFDYGKTV